MWGSGDTQDRGVGRVVGRGRCSSRPARRESANPGGAGGAYRGRGGAALHFPGGCARRVCHVTRARALEGGSRSARRRIRRSWARDATLATRPALVAEVQVRPQGRGCLRGDGARLHLRARPRLRPRRSHCRDLGPSFPREEGRSSRCAGRGVCLLEACLGPRAGPLLPCEPGVSGK